MLSPIKQIKASQGFNEEEKKSSKVTLSKKSAPFKSNGAAPTFSPQKHQCNHVHNDDDFDEDILNFKNEFLKLDSTKESLDFLIETWDNCSNK